MMRYGYFYPSFVNFIVSANWSFSIVNYNDEFSVLNSTNKSRRKQMTGIFAFLQQSKERCQSLQICLPNLSIDGSDKFNTFFTFQKRKNVQIELGVLQIKCYKLPS